MSERAAEKIAAEAKDYWVVKPEPGFVIKTKCTVNGPSPNPSKLFINIAHCPQLPPPMEDWQEDELLRKMEADPSQIRIPDLRRAVDVLLNSAFYRKRVDGSEFYRQLLFLVVIHDIELKHGLTIDAKTHVILRKNTVWDELATQHIRKTPAECLIAEETKAKPINYEDIELNPALNTLNFRARVMAGRFVEVTLQPADASGRPIGERERLRVKMNEDRLVVIADNKRAIVDFYSPFRFARRPGGRRLRPRTRPPHHSDSDRLVVRGRLPTFHSCTSLG
ncbi:putative D-lactate dehydrogenase, mitochondrial [Aphelenchoides fujianensis]|nr:putative D-lactate dehydrogenase, mitochondrial [Aphelenchoides fujianensis]